MSQESRWGGGPSKYAAPAEVWFVQFWKRPKDTTYLRSTNSDSKISYFTTNMGHCARFKLTYPNRQCYINVPNIKPIVIGFGKEDFNNILVQVSVKLSQSTTIWKYFGFLSIV